MRRALIAGFASLLAAALIATAAQGTGVPVSTASRAQCTAGKGVCAKVAGHRLKRLHLVFLTRRVRKRSYAVGVGPAKRNHTRLDRTFVLGRGGDETKFDRVRNGFRSTITHKTYVSIWKASQHRFDNTRPGRYRAHWSWPGSRSALRLNIVFWIKRDGRVIVRP